MSENGQITYEEEEKLEQDILEKEVTDILEKEVRDILEKKPKKEGDKRGGHREGAGRPRVEPVYRDRSKNAVAAKQAASMKKKVREYMTEKDTQLLMKRIKTWAKGDKRMAMWLADQVFGKARQNMGLDGGTEGAPITMAALLDSMEEPKKLVKGTDNVYQ